MAGMMSACAKHARQGTLGLVVGLRLRQVGARLLGNTLYQRVQFRRKVGYWPNFRAPRSFNEKIGWYKYHFKDPRLPLLKDKLAVREHVRNVAPELRLPEIYFVAASEDEIPFDQLPEKCVIKANHGSSAQQVIFYDRSISDPTYIKRQCARWLRSGYDLWAFKEIPRRVIGESLLLDERGSTPVDYKVFVFNGRAMFVALACDRFSVMKYTWFDCRWNAMEFSWGMHPRKPDAPRPAQLELMLDSAERLAGDLPLVRVDYYEISGEVCFGEISFYPAGGLWSFIPQEWDFKLGKQLHLPSGSGTTGCRR